MVRQDKCAVSSCLAVRDPTKNISLHKLPQDEDSFAFWADFLRKANGVGPSATRKHLVCSQHFHSSCIGNGPMNKRFILAGHAPSLLNAKELKACSKCSPYELSDISILVEPPNPDFDKPYIAKPSQNESEIATLKCAVQKLNEEANKVPGLQASLENARKEIKRLNMQLTRKGTELNNWKRKIEGLNGLNGCSKKLKLDSEVQTEYSFEDCPKAGLILEMMSRKSRTLPYSDAQREFAFKVHFYSPKAYNFLRRSLNYCLPHPLQFSRWTRPVDPTPGILKQSINYMKQCNADGILMYYSLAFDEVAIRRHFGMFKGKVTGFVDYGGISVEDDPKKEARNALFCLATEINGSKSFPVAYILTNGLTANTMKKFISTCVNAVRETGGIVTNITFDGHRSNLRAAELLGARLNGRDPEFRPFFDTEDMAHVYVIPDASHMYKLLKEYVEKSRIELHRLQSDCGFRAANKLTGRHIDFKQQIMKTKLALHVTSNSTATGIETARLLNIPQFQNSEATVKFLRLFDRVFDFLNSKTTGKGFKSPISQRNSHIWRPFIERSKEYILGLKMHNEKGVLISAFDHKLGTFARGIYAAICSLEAIVEEYCTTDGALRYVPTFKNGQDNLELFFGKVRSRHGCNNNPSSIQLQHTVRSLLCYNVGAPWNGNCVPQEEAFNKIAPTSCLKTLMSDGDDVPLEVNEEDHEQVQSLPMSPHTQSFVDAVITYIAGFVGTSVSTQLKC
ncbi:DNA transposase THAP9, partial [Orchesella cincta]